MVSVEIQSSELEGQGEEIYQSTNKNMEFGNLEI